jgi:hypothetical protein
MCHVPGLETEFQVGHDHMSPMKLEQRVDGDRMCLFNDNLNFIGGAKGGN